LISLRIFLYDLSIGVVAYPSRMLSSVARPAGKITRLFAMNVAYVSALSALAGSVIGGLTSGFAAWLNQHSETRANRLAQDLSRRQELYKEFILTASKAYGVALISDEPQVQELVELYAMVSRMRVLSAPKTIICADKVMRVTIDTYYTPNRTLREVNELLKSGNGVDPLREFSEAAREELQELLGF
jgi:hypothetical protein